MASIAGSQRSMRPSSIFEGSILVGAALALAAETAALNPASTPNIPATKVVPENFNMENPFVSCLKS
jgi:hypothetical protein